MPEQEGKLTQPQKILNFLRGNEGVILPHETINDNCFDGPVEINIQHLRDSVRYIRKQLPGCEYIETVWGVGYCYHPVTDGFDPENIFDAQLTFADVGEGVEIDTSRRKIRFTGNETIAKVNPTELKLLIRLLSDPENTVSHEDLVKYALGEDFILGEEEKVSSYLIKPPINALNKVLNPSGYYIKSKWSRGYYLTDRENNKAELPVFSDP